MSERNAGGYYPRISLNGATVLAVVWGRTEPV